MTPSRDPQSNRNAQMNSAGARAGKTCWDASSRQRQPIYEVLAQQNGIHLPRAESRQQEGQRRVVHAMRDATEVLSAEMAVRRLDGQPASTMRRLLFCRTMHLKYKGEIRSAPLTPFPLLCYP